MATEIKNRYTLEEYFELERTSEERYEYFNGEVFCMSGGTLSHDRITGNVFDMLRALTSGAGCNVFTNNMQIKVSAAPPYRYADGSVVCGGVEVERLQGNDLLVNPVLLYEVLSPSTEAFGRGDKFTYYKSIRSLREYLLVAQHRPHVTHYVKQDDGKWDYEEINEIDGHINLPSINCVPVLSEIYRDVEFSRDPRRDES